MEQIRPIRPEEVSKEKVIPLFVIESVNELLNEKSRGKGQTVTILLKDIKERVRSKTDADLNDSWFDFEPLYREAGWCVVFDSPGYNESYSSFFEFTPKK
jgi:hypothetical protein